METSSLTEDVPSTSHTPSVPSSHRTVLQQELINIRNSIKKIQDWMPPTASSSPAADVQSTLESKLAVNGCSLRQFDGMTRSTLLKCFEKIVDVVEKKSHQEQTIVDLLSKYPLIRPVAKGIMMSINMFQIGMEVEQIALQRDLETSTIMSHLCTGLLTNSRIDLGRLLPASKLASIIQVLRSPSINYDMKALAPIKKLCRNPRATSHDLSICRAYLEVRQHLTALNMSYEDEFSLVTIDNKSEYKSILVSPEHNNLTFLSKCVFPPRSKDKKGTKKKEKEENTLNIIPSSSTAVSKNQVNGIKIDPMITDVHDPSYENIQNFNIPPVPVKDESLDNDLPQKLSVKDESFEINLLTQSDIHPITVRRLSYLTDFKTELVLVKNESLQDLPQELSVKVESCEVNLLTQSDIKPRSIKLDIIPTVIDISDSDITDEEFQQNENATESKNFKGSIPAVGISDDKILFSNMKIPKNEPSLSHEKSKHLKPIHEEIPQPKSNHQDVFDIEWDGDDKVKIENVDKKVCKTIVLNDTDSDMTITDDDNDDDLNKSTLDVKDADIEVLEEGISVAPVKHEVKSEANSFTTSTVIDVNTVQDKVKPTRKRKLDIHSTSSK